MTDEDLETRTLHTREVATDSEHLEGLAASDGEPTYDVMNPWGEEGPAPVGQWRTDILGPAYQSQTIELIADAEGDNVATLVKYLPHRDPDVSENAKAFPKSLSLIHI